ncbi:MAG: HAD-IA family hydrolase [Candidatus Dormibacteraeota bacterium]|nr:HAD-IA family hydrolase [Candidatus Dormibacteraeota bacterium]
MRRPQAICFDMGYTLLRHAPTGPELYRRVLSSLGHEVALELIEQAHAPARELYVRATREGRDFEASMDLAHEFWTEYNLLVLGGLGLAEARLEELGEAVYTRAWSPEAWQPFPDALPALQELRRLGIRMAIVSNFVDTLPALCDRHGLTEYFDVIVASVDAGAMKPDPRIWDVALRRLGVDAADAWHIGDNYWADVLGARAAGLCPVFLDRDGAVPRADCARVCNLDELVEMVRAVEGAEAAA